MKRLRHWLIASKKNKFHPKLLEPIGLGVIVLILAFLPFFYNASHGSAQILGYATDISSGGLNAATNAQRSAASLGSLTINGQLTTAAQNKAAHMFANQYWAHTAPDGTTPWSFVTGAGYSYSVVGENLAKNFMTSSGVVNAWMNSAGHRANLMNAQFVDVGYGIQNGVLQGEEVTLVVAMYGAPKAQAPPPAPAQTTPAPTAPTQTTTPKAQQATPTPAAETPTETPAEAAPQPTEETPTPVNEAQVQTTQERQKEDPLTTDATPVPEGEIMGIQSLAPVQAYMGLNWAQRISIFILASLAVLFVMKHTIIWRHQRRGIKAIWMKSHPLAQSALLGLAVVILLMTGTGTIL